MSPSVYAAVEVRLSRYLDGRPIVEVHPQRDAVAHRQSPPRRFRRAGGMSTILSGGRHHRLSPAPSRISLFLPNSISPRSLT